VKELNGLLVAKEPREKTLERARAGLKSLESELGNLAHEKESLFNEAAEFKLNKASLDLKEGEQRLSELRARRSELQRFIEGLEAVDKEETDPIRQQWRQQIEQARLAESEADFDKAIAIYESI